MKKNINGTIYISTQNISRKGALFIEYALLLAFVAIVGVTFTADSSIGGNITNIFSKTASVLDGTNKSGGLEEKLKQYTTALSGSAMIHSGTQDKEAGIRYYSLGKELASGGSAHEPNFGNQLRAAGIDGAYAYQGMSAAYGKLSEEDKKTFREEHYLGTGDSICSLIVSTDGNTTWETGQSYNAVQYMTYKGKVNKQDTQIVGSYRNIIVNVDAKGKKTYTDTAGNSINISSASNDGGGWQKFSAQ